MNWQVAFLAFENALVLGLFFAVATLVFVLELVAQRHRVYVHDRKNADAIVFAGLQILQEDGELHPEAVDTLINAVEPGGRLSKQLVGLPGVTLSCSPACEECRVMCKTGAAAVLNLILNAREAEIRREDTAPVRVVCDNKLLTITNRTPWGLPTIAREHTGKMSVSLAQQELGWRVEYEEISDTHIVRVTMC